MSDFWAMGGYAAYIWPAYAVSFIGLMGMIVVTWRSYRAAQAKLAALEKP
jgi:heme exporter protein D